MGKEGIPFVMVFTKSDKISQTQISKNIKQYKQEMLKNWSFYQIYSSLLPKKEME